MAKEKKETESGNIKETDTTTEVIVENKGKELTSQTNTSLSSSNLIKEFERKQGLNFQSSKNFRFIKFNK